LPNIVLHTITSIFLRKWFDFVHFRLILYYLKTVVDNGNAPELVKVCLLAGSLVRADQSLGLVSSLGTTPTTTNPEA